MFDFADPIMLLLLPLPYFIYIYQRNSHKNIENYREQGVKLPFIYALHNALESQSIGIRKNWTLMWLIIIWILIVCALAGPRWVGKPFREINSAHQLMLVLDVSPSMGIVDRVLANQPVNRLTLVKKTALNFLEHRESDRVGLILFGSKAFVQTPLTYDHKHLMARLNQASVGLLGQSTAIGDALGLAIKNMKQSSADKIVILLTDGANNAGVLPPIKAASIAAEQGINLYIIGLDENQQNDIFGSAWSMNNASDLDEKTLKKMVNIAHGKYFRATDLNSLANAYDAIDKLSTVKAEGALIHPQIFYYDKLLFMAAVIFLLASIQRLFLANGKGDL